MSRRMALLGLCTGLTLLAQSAGATAVFAAPKRYARVAAEIDYGPQATSYLGFGRKAYAQAVADAKNMAIHINDFLDAPSEASLADARQAWRDARPAYSRTETLRFVNSPIDQPGSAEIPPGPELRINAWPVNEAVMDSVRGAPGSGLIGDSVSLDEALLIASNQARDEADVTLGWHAIEFLLWGQDFNAEGPGQRSYKEFLPGDAQNDRRRRYLKLVTSILVRDLESVAEEWSAAGSYSAFIEKEAPVEVVGRLLHGAASLAAIELYGERMTVALDSRSQEDEHSCFSDNTLADLSGNLEGIRWLLMGRYDDQNLGSSVLELVEWRDPTLAGRLLAALDDASAQLAKLDQPFDQIILLPDNDPLRAQAERTAESMRQVAVQLKAVAERLGIDIVVPGV